MISVAKETRQKIDVYFADSEQFFCNSYLSWAFGMDEKVA